jgi:hypothetical protein
VQIQPCKRGFPSGSDFFCKIRRARKRSWRSAEILLRKSAAKVAAVKNRGFSLQA